MRSRQTILGQKMSEKSGMAKGWTPNRRMRKAIGKVDMGKLDEAKARPGLWKKGLKKHAPDAKKNKHLTVPALIEDRIVEDVSNGMLNTEVEKKYQLNSGIVRSVLIRRFGSIEQMKKALAGQCFENAILLNEHVAQNVEFIAPGQAAVAAKIMIDGGIALGKAITDRPATVDFDALLALGGVLESIEKRLDSNHARVVESS